MGWRCRDTWWWNEEVTEAVSSMKEAHMAMSQSSTEENKRRYGSMKNKAVSKAMREMVEGALTELLNCPNGMFGLVNLLIPICKEVEGV